MSKIDRLIGAARSWKFATSGLTGVSLFLMLLMPKLTDGGGLG
ncbi:hypothetical protein [Neobacillus niacini]|nr:hypothetical protein [Neobacillus niacini]